MKYLCLECANLYEEERSCNRCGSIRRKTVKDKEEVEPIYHDDKTYDNAD